MEGIWIQNTSNKDAAIMKKDITVCDFCNYPGKAIEPWSILFECIGCSKDCCQNCKGLLNLNTNPLLQGSSVPKQLCKTCIEKPEIVNLILQYDNKIDYLCTERDAKISILDVVLGK